MVVRPCITKASPRTAYAENSITIEQGTTTIEFNRENRRFIITHPNGAITVRLHRCSAREAAKIWYRTHFHQRREQDPTLEIGVGSIRWL